MRDLELVFRSQGFESHHLEPSIFKETTNQVCLGETEEMSHITEEPVTKASDATQVGTERRTLPLIKDSACLTHGDLAHEPMDLNIEVRVTDNDASSKPSLLMEHDKVHTPEFVTSRGTGFDLNAEAFSSSDPLYPYRIPVCVKSGDASECGSSTGPLEEKDHMRVWNEMKQNGFLSMSHGGIPIPKKRGRKSKNEVLNKKLELAKREQVNRFTKIAAPSGLLNELNPGIINHVRNSKQVHSIIEALVRSDKLENVYIQSEQAKKLKKGTGEISNGKKCLGNLVDFGTSWLDLHHVNDLPNTLSGSRQARGYPLSLNGHMHMGSEHNGGVGDLGIAERRVECEDDKHVMKLSTSITMALENASSPSNEESANQASVSSLAVKAATVASQWLELLYQDIRGRLEALRRSRKRAQAVSETELPLLISIEFSSNQENDQSSSAGCPIVSTSDMHRAKWMALFDQMDKALYEEAKLLESWLNQVKEMQLHCDRGLHCVSWYAGHGLQQPGISQSDTRSENADYSESKLTITAAAASIYSTCNFIMSGEDVSCF